MQRPTSASIYGQPIQHIKKQRHYFGNKCLSSQRYGFSNTQVWMWELDHKESWGPNNWCFLTVVLEKTLESPWTSRRSHQSILKEISPQYSFIGRTDIDAEALILWTPDGKNWLIWKDPDARKEWKQEEKGMTEDEWLDGITDLIDMNLSKLWVFMKDREALYDAVRGVSVSDMTEQLNWTWHRS